jgi:hypothetical protein
MKNMKMMMEERRKKLLSRRLLIRATKYMDKIKTTSATQRNKKKTL